MKAMGTMILMLGLVHSAWAQNARDLLGSITPNAGQYSNRIADVTPPLPFTEVCIKGGSVLVDQHLVSESTRTGPNCDPGDTGWILEQNERSAGISWELAKMECLKDGMRLPEPFEFKYSCVNAASFGLNDMEGNWEWASNSAAGPEGRIAATILGRVNCNSGSTGSVANGVTNSDGQHGFRCAK